jgi:spoIIIJ-associated protein
MSEGNTVAEEAVEEKAAVKESKAPKTIAKLEEEGDIAADYLEALLDIADLDGDIDIDVENDRASLAIVGGSPASPSKQRPAIEAALCSILRVSEQIDVAN